jgi:hypothetical protein
MAAHKLRAYNYNLQLMPEKMIRSVVEITPDYSNAYASAVVDTYVFRCRRLVTILIDHITASSNK